MTVKDRLKFLQFRTIFLLGQLASLLVIISIWILAFGIYVTDWSKLVSSLIIFGIFLFLWKLKSNTKKTNIQLSLKSVSIFLSLGITFTSLNLLGFNLQSPPDEFIQINIWLLLLLVSMIFVQIFFQSRYINDRHYEKYPPFRVDLGKVFFVIPAFNEGNNIGILIRDLRNLYPESQIVVIDNNSSDNTYSEAKNAGAIVLQELEQGKGIAVRTGFTYISQFDYNVAIMLDGDLTYHAEDALKLINYSAAGGYGIILGSRIKGKRASGSITSLNILGNYILTFFANFFYGTDHSDVCTGYWLFRKEAVDLLNRTGIKSTGFGLEAEMVSIFAQNDIVSIDLSNSFGIRAHGKSNLRPFRDGLRILYVLFFNWLFSRHLSEPN